MQQSASAWKKKCEKARWEATELPELTVTQLERQLTAAYKTGSRRRKAKFILVREAAAEKEAYLQEYIDEQDEDENEPEQPVRAKRLRKQRRGRSHQKQLQMKQMQMQQMQPQQMQPQQMQMQQMQPQQISDPEKKNAP